jgi:hypothetical protein
MFVLAVAAAGLVLPQPTPIRSVPRKQLVQLRGGILPAATPELLTKTVASVIGAASVAQWVSPEASVTQALAGAAGVKSPSQASSTIFRISGAWSGCTAMVLMAGKRGCAKAASSFGLYAAALTMLAVIPPWDTLGREKASMVATALVFGVLGKYTLAGVLTPKLAPALYLLIGGLIFGTPKSTAELYKVSAPMDDLAYSMMSVMGAAIFNTGVYLAALASGLGQMKSLAALCFSCAASAVHFTRSFVDKFDGSTVPGLIWAAVGAALGGLALQYAQVAGTWGPDERD